MPASVMRSRPISIAEAYDCIETMREFNEPDAYILVSLTEGKRTRDFFLTTTHPVGLENFDQQNLPVLRFISQKYRGMEIAQQLETFFQQILNTRQYSWRGGGIAFPDKDYFMPIGIEFMDHDQWQISFTSVNRSFHLWSSLPETETRPKLLKDLIRALERGLGCQLAGIREEGSIIRLENNSSRLIESPVNQHDSVSDLRFEIMLSSAEFVPVLNAFGELWEDRGFSTRFDFEKAFLINDYDLWCKVWNGPLGYYKVGAEGRLKKAVRMDFQNRSPSIDGLIPVFDFDVIIDHEAQFFGNVSIEFAGDRSSIYVSTKGKAEDWVLVKFVRDFGLEGIFQDEGAQHFN